MQIINLDLSRKGIIATLQTKQGDVGRQFQAVVTDNGKAYSIPEGAMLSVWYSGASGDGNYSEIDGESAFTITGNCVTVTLIAQMLANPGAGILCLMLHGADGTQIATWNILYQTEAVPGVGSVPAIGNNSFVEDVLNRMGQLKPEFANSVAECTDTTKLYVLPDGYIYAYMSIEGALFEDHLKHAVDAGGSAYNGGLGYAVGMYLTSGGVEQDKSETYPKCAISGFIPYDQENMIRISGIVGNTQGRIFFYGEDRATIIHSVSYSELIGYNDGSGYFEELNGSDVFVLDVATFKEGHSYYGGLITNSAKYIRVTWFPECDTANAYVAMDEELTFGTSQTWRNTGHAFVPADYEMRIIDLEEAEEAHAERLNALEAYGTDMTTDDVPAYIKTAAGEVLDKVLAKQGSRAFNLIALSDFHYGGTGNNKENLIRACKAVSYITGRIHVDAVATLGDNTPGAEGTEEAMTNVHRWFKEVNEILSITQGSGIVDLRTPGNHDRLGAEDTAFMPDNAIYSYVTGYNRQSVVGDVPGGWCYHDFGGHRLRIIVLNTSECEGKGRFSEYCGYRISTKQYNWLIGALDLSGKEDADEWQVLILCHHRPDDPQEPVQLSDGTEGYVLPQILQAYHTGGSFAGTRAESGDLISCDFAGKNAARLIGVIHGHHHSYTYGNLAQTQIMAVSTPTTAFLEDGGNADNDGNTYVSTRGTAEETAFCLYSIDLDNRIIHAIHYGAGVDRDIRC